MSLSLEIFPPTDPRYYQTVPPLTNLQYPNRTHWLTSASPIARATSFSQPYAPEQFSALSSDSSSFTMETLGSHQTDSREQLFNDFSPQPHPAGRSLSHLHISALENTSTWDIASQYQTASGVYDASNMLSLPPHFGSGYSGGVSPVSPYSTPSLYDESAMGSSCFSSPDLAYAAFNGLPPRSLPTDDYEYEDEEDPQGGKPYARLIFDALVQAPDHRMMLRDIYDWFEKNTTKPRESGTNGWQNSIRHNLSMNHAFENDKTQSTNARGEPKKASSVWFLTENALRNGVQSTTRYRKNGGVRRSAHNGRPDAMRAKSGAKGGRAARRAARLRQIEQSPHVSWESSLTPDDLGSFNHLIHAANAMGDFTSTRDNSPASALSQYPYTSHSLGSKEELSAQSGYKIKYNGGESPLDSCTSEALLLSQRVDDNFDDTWFQASQRS